ncbi:MAG TPA: GDYXXLXY domain-containing protein, partial [Chondromyces sp.]|nr:GDYXXLXY domain-containing protein [Chondromyces sp.]
VGISLKGEHLAVVRLTLIITGIVFIFFFAFMQQSLWTVWFINFLFAVIAVLLFKKKSALPFYLASNAGAAYGLFITAGELNFPEESIKLLLLLLGAVNILVFRLFKETPMGLLAYLLSISFLFSLTMDVSTSPLWLNILYHLLLMSYLFIHLTRPQSCSRIYRWATWAAVVYFLIWKYYEYVWSLMHKSLAFFIVSAIFFLIFYLWGRNISGRTDQPSWRWKPVLAVLALQLVIIGMTVYQKETILKEGELVALKLEPLDPRSLLQGDYVQLNYTIHNQYSDMYADRDGENGKIQVLLKRTNQSVNYQGKEISIFEAGEFRNGTGKVGVNEDTVSIQGISKYHTLTLGIEHFFIPENTGREWEEMDYALVRVAKNGDAILETLIDIE